jgi:hypothetical protein
MKLLTVALLLAAIPAAAQDKPKPAKLVYRTLDKMLKDFSHLTHGPKITPDSKSLEPELTTARGSQSL